MRRFIVGGAVVALLAGLATRSWIRVQAKEPPAPKSSYGRVSVVDGKLLVRGSGDKDWSYLSRNGVVRDGDTIWADEKSSAEIEMERGAWVRMGPDTRVEVRRLSPSGELVLNRGSAYVDLSKGSRQSLAVVTPSGRVNIPDGSLTRVDWSGDNSARVLVRRGDVALRPTSAGAISRAQAGQLAYLYPGNAPVRIQAIDRMGLDAFDQWADRRANYYRTARLPRNLKYHLPGSYELARSGQWVNYQGRSYWRPRGVANTWRPYSRGYWAGWDDQPYWVDSAPWGYTTSHYGRWNWAQGQGWLWRPDYAWSPAQVQWADAGSNILWAPLGINNLPVFRSQPVSLGGALLDSLVWSAMPRTSFLSGVSSLITPLSALRPVQLSRIRMVRDPVALVGNLPRELRLRGLRRLGPTTVLAADRFRVLERIPLRRGFRVASITRTVPKVGGAKSVFVGKSPWLAKGNKLTGVKSAGIRSKVLGKRERISTTGKVRNHWGSNTVKGRAGVRKSGWVGKTHARTAIRAKRSGGGGGGGHGGARIRDGGGHGGGKGGGGHGGGHGGGKGGGGGGKGGGGGHGGGKGK